MPPVIRAAQSKDAPQVAALWNEMIRNSLATFTTLEKTTDEITTLIRARPGAFFVLDEGEAAGFATFGSFRGGPGYAATAEHTILLAPQAQGRGLGRRLLVHLEQAAAAAGIHVLVAGISSANPNAMAFHAQLGFSETARMPEVGRKNGQWLDLILMQKTLSRP